MVNTTRQGNKGTGQSSSQSEEDNMNKVCTNFLMQLEEKLDARMEKLDAKLTHVCNTLTNLSTTVDENSKGVMELRQKIDVLEQDRKRKFLRFPKLLMKI